MCPNQAQNADKGFLLLSRKRAHGLCRRFVFGGSDHMITPEQQAAIKRLPATFRERGIPQVDPHATGDWDHYEACKQAVKDAERDLGIHVAQTGEYAAVFYEACLQQVRRYLGM